MKRDGGEATSNKRRGDSTRTGKNSVIDFFLDAFPDKAKSRITHRGGSRIGHQTQFLTAPQAGHQFRKASFLIMLMETYERLANLQMSQQLGRPARILGDDPITAAQCVYRPQREVSEIADRRGN